MKSGNADGAKARLERALREGSYQPQAVRRSFIAKPGSREKRALGIPTVRDRTVEAALRQVIEPIFEHRFAEHGYGFRPGRGRKEALRQVALETAPERNEIPFRGRWRTLGEA